MLHCYHTLKARNFQEKIGIFTERTYVNACLCKIGGLCYTFLMNDLNTNLLQKASGETRLNPDEQRLYMNTFRERVLLVITFEEIQQAGVQAGFHDLANQLSARHAPLFLKLAPSLSDSLQIRLMKEAQDLGITTSIIDEKVANCPFALVFHTDHAVNLEDIQLASQFPQLLTGNEKKEEKKPSFWKKLFG